MQSDRSETTPSQAARSPFNRVGVGLALVVCVLAGWGFFAFWLSAPVAHFPEATLCVSQPDGHEFCSIGLQDSQSSQVLIPGAITASVKPRALTYVDKKTGYNLLIEWRLLRSKTSADSYEFRITSGSNVVPRIKLVDVSNDAVELFRDDDVVVTISCHERTLSVR